MFKKIFNHLRSIKSIDLACSATNYLEKFFWFGISIIGTLWVCYVIPIQLKLWKEKSTIITKGNFELSELNLPAITICSKGSTKYAIAERLGNFVDPKFGLTEDLRSIRNEILVYVMELRYYKVTRASSCSYSDTVPKEGCKVSDFYQYYYYIFYLFLKKVDLKHVI